MILDPTEALNKAFYDCMPLAGVALQQGMELVRDNDDGISDNESDTQEDDTETMDFNNRWCFDEFPSFAVNNGDTNGDYVEHEDETTTSKMIKVGSSILSCNIDFDEGNITVRNSRINQDMGTDNNKETETASVPHDGTETQEVKSVPFVTHTNDDENETKSMEVVQYETKAQDGLDVKDKICTEENNNGTETVKIVQAHEGTQEDILDDESSVSSSISFIPYSRDATDECHHGYTVFLAKTEDGFMINLVKGVDNSALLGDYYTCFRGYLRHASGQIPMVETLAMAMS